MAEWSFRQKPARFHGAAPRHAPDHFGIGRWSVERDWLRSGFAQPRLNLRVLWSNPFGRNAGRSLLRATHGERLRGGGNARFVFSAHASDHLFSVDLTNESRRFRNFRVSHRIHLVVP